MFLLTAVLYTMLINKLKLCQCNSQIKLRGLYARLVTGEQFANWERSFSLEQLPAVPTCFNVGFETQNIRHTHTAVQRFLKGTGHIFIIIKKTYFTAACHGQEFALWVNSCLFC